MSREAPKAQCGVHPLRSGGVERDHCSQRHCAARRVNQPELVVGRVIPDHHMCAIVGVASCDLARPVGKQDRRCPGCGGRRCEDDNCRQYVGAPENGRFICAPVRVRQEIVTPSAWRDLWSQSRLGLRRRRRRSDSRGYGAGTPRRCRETSCLSRDRMQLVTASPLST